MRFASPRPVSWLLPALLAASCAAARAPTPPPAPPAANTACGELFRSGSDALTDCPVRSLNAAAQVAYGFLPAFVLDLPPSARVWMYSRGHGAPRYARVDFQSARAAASFYASQVKSLEATGGVSAARVVSTSPQTSGASENQDLVDSPPTWWVAADTVQDAAVIQQPAAIGRSVNDPLGETLYLRVDRSVFVQNWRTTQPDIKAGTGR